MAKSQEMGSYKQFSVVDADIDVKKISRNNSDMLETAECKNNRNTQFEIGNLTFFIKIV